MASMASRGCSALFLRSSVQASRARAFKDSNRSQSLYIVVERLANSRTRADIIDGGLRFLHPNTHLSVLGTALLRDGLKSGTFTIVDHLGGGVTGKAVFTGQWDCGTRRTQ